MPDASWSNFIEAVELKVTLMSATGALVVYSPGYEAQRARFTQQESFGLIPFAEPNPVREGHRRSV
jgi:hypothetical protein